MERVIVKQIQIVNANQQVLFQIRLPRDSKRIIGALVTITAIKTLRNQEPGWLWLSTPFMGKTFYCEILNEKPKNYGISNMPMIQQPGIADGSLWLSGSKIEFSTLNCPVSETIVEGFYSDQRTVDGKYTVSIYLKIEL